jgi:2-polyprenyl-6-hydroxyphenyl methylase/3-demethylubiquinone-9 3-methyltransferase
MPKVKLIETDDWEKVWKKYRFNSVTDAWELEWEKSQPRWKQAARLFDSQWGGLKGRAVVELGCGRATESLLAAQEGAIVTLVDKNKRVLDLARKRFKYYGLERELQIVQSDILSLDRKLSRKFDVCISEGLAEHFTGKARQKVITAHARVLKPGGIAMISVPNRWSLPYRLWMKREQILGRWPYGLEVPYSANELKKRIKRAKLTLISITGSPVINDMLFLFVPPRFRKLRFFICLTPFDSRQGHALTALAKLA